jgi:hypothetical protein
MSRLRCRVVVLVSVSNRQASVVAGALLCACRVSVGGASWRWESGDNTLAMTRTRPSYQQSTHGGRCDQCWGSASIADSDISPAARWIALRFGATSNTGPFAIGCDPPYFGVGARIAPTPNRPTGQFFSFSVFRASGRNRSAVSLDSKPRPPPRLGLRRRFGVPTGPSTRIAASVCPDY